jgi:hypothetical protein
MHLRERTHDRLAKCIERRVMTREKLAHHSLVEARITHRASDVLAALLQLTAMFARHLEKLFDSSSDDFFLTRRRIESLEYAPQEEEGHGGRAVIPTSTSVRPEWASTFSFGIVLVAPRAAARVIAAAATREASMVPVAETTVTTTTTQCVDKADEASGTDEESEHVSSPARLSRAAFRSGAKHRSRM